MDNRKNYMNILICLLLFNLKRVISLPESDREIICGLTIYPSGNFIGWDSRAQRDCYIRRGWYLPKNILPTRFQMNNKNIFLAIPRLKCGVPFTLGVLNINEYCKSEPIMRPYPDWSINRIDKSFGLHNVVDLVIDDEGILWVLDVGVINTLTQPKLLDLPKLIAFCLQTNKIINIISLKPVATTKSRFQFLQTERVGNKTYVYISDAGTHSIVIWDTFKNTGSKIKLSSAIHEGADDCVIDVLYIALLKKKCSKNFLYITYLHSKMMYHIDTSTLRSANLRGSVDNDGPKPGKIVILGTDGGRTLFFRLRGKGDIFIWNSNETYVLNNFLLTQPIESTRLPTHVTFGYQRLIWSMESNFPDFMSDRLTDLGPSIKLHPVIRYCQRDFNTTFAT